MDAETSHWITVDVDEGRARALAAELEMPLPVAKVLVSRGINSKAAAEKFLHPRLSDLSDPLTMPGMAAAVERVWKAIDNEERITIYGDYDCDGVTSTALLMLVLQDLGATVNAFIPKRLEDGYGFTIGTLDKVLEETNPSLIITADCGTRSADAVVEATEQDVDVIITDHHEGQNLTPPDAVAVINPKFGGPAGVAELAGVGVAFKLCHAVVKQAVAEGRDCVGSVDLRDYLDLVAIGTVADVVPLTGENRTLVRHGLARLNDSTARCGLQALIRVAGIRTRLDCYHLGFLIGPRLNAAGRLGSADVGLELLMTEDPSRARRLAGQLDASNRERKRIEETIIENAAADIEKTFEPEHSFGLVASRRGWHIGTIGIVAARLAGRFKRPAVVISIDEDGLGRASCRSVNSVNLVHVLDQCADLLESYGGHNQAAGLRIREENVEAFRERFNAACQKSIDEDDIGLTHTVDAWISLRDADQGLIEAVDSLRPLGLGNPTPIWGIKGAKIQGQPKLVGSNHLKMTVVCGGSQIDAIGFGMAGRKLGRAEHDFLVQVQQNSYMGRQSIQLSLKDFKFREGHAS